MKGTYNPKTRGYEMDQAVYDSIGNELKVGTFVYWKSANVMAEVGHIISAQKLPGAEMELPGEMILMVRCQIKPEERTVMTGLIAVQVPPQTTVQAKETPKMEPVAVGANEEGG